MARSKTDIDWEAARQVLARNWPQLEPTTLKYAALLESLADLHLLCGPKNFELRYNLRPPRDRTEEWTQQYMQGTITDVELRNRFKTDALRPIDLEMLTAFHNAYHDNLLHYSLVLQNAVIRPSEVGTSAVRNSEQAIDEHIAVLRDKLPLWRENLETVHDFLEELRVTSGKGLVKVGEYEGTSAHWLAQLLFIRLSEAWRSCRDISERSHQDPRYTYAARAIDLFAEKWSKSFPAPQPLSERLREEFILARAALKRTTMSSHQVPTMTVEGAIDRARSIDNESRELMLLGEMYVLAGQAGHIFRMTANSDWGIDGEIEFKDNTGRASGRRLYVQLKSGDSYLVHRSSDGAEVFTVKNDRHLEYWVLQAYPVMLVIRQSNGAIRWMDISAYLKERGQKGRQIVFDGHPVTIESIQKYAAGL
jgi:hypothetical protein